MKTLLLVLLMTGCTGVCLTDDSYKDKERIKELEAFIAGCQDDNAKLQSDVIHGENRVRAYQRGGEIMADQIAKMRRGCET